MYGIIFFMEVINKKIGDKLDYKNIYPVEFRSHYGKNNNLTLKVLFKKIQ